MTRSTLKPRAVQALMLLLAAGAAGGFWTERWRLAFVFSTLLVLLIGIIVAELMKRTGEAIRRMTRAEKLQGRTNGRIDASLEQILNSEQDREINTGMILARVTDQQIWITEILHAARANQPNEEKNRD